MVKFMWFRKLLQNNVSKGVKKVLVELEKLMDCISSYKRLWTATPQLEHWNCHTNRR